jgi:hypothetical protein
LFIFQSRLAIADSDNEVLKRTVEDLERRLFMLEAALGGRTSASEPSLAVPPPKPRPPVRQKSRDVLRK